MIALSGILIGLPPLGHKYSFAPSLAFDKHRRKLLANVRRAADKEEKNGIGRRRL